MSEGLSEKAIELVKELSRKTNSLPAYNEQLVKQVLDETATLCQVNQTDVAQVMSGPADGPNLYPSILARHAIIDRNKRCLLAYHVNRLDRLKECRWQSGSVLPPDVRSTLSDDECDWFRQYSRSLASYMQAIGGPDNDGLDLTQDQQPPKSLYVQVRVKTDYGEFETSDGSVLLLKADSTHSMLRTDCERLIRENVLEQMTSLRSRPQLELAGSVTYITTVPQAEAALACILDNASCVVCGFDAEWTVSYDSARQLPVSVVQISVNDGDDSYSTYVLQLNALCGENQRKLPACLQRLLIATKILKVGVNIVGDIERLSRDFDLPADHITRKCVLDLSSYANRVLNSNEHWSLAGLVLNQLKHQLDKSDDAPRLSDWHRYPLTPQQIQYAALDAFVSGFCNID